MIRTILSTIILGAALVSTAPARAQEAMSAHVTFGDLNLTSPQGRDAFHGRLERAVADVCGAADLRDLAAVRAQRACRTQARAAVASQEQQATAAALSATRLALASYRHED